MTSVPPNPKIFHITHIKNLPSIVKTQGLLSDAHRIAHNVSCSLVGMSSIKQRRLNHKIPCYPETTVGQYVPFYFCPRSIMLYILYQRNHPELDYTDGQQPIVHLQADLRTVIAWADSHHIPWVFTTGNASARLTNFYNDLTQLGEVHWEAVAARDFRDPKIKEGKQAEFLCFDVFPWALIDKIGTIDQMIATQVTAILGNDGHQPAITPEPTWYF